mmetsp:Transcript_53958/g.125951  ORF Transcript_53958/g.125951 Transcript_53958/m.125951 type:complete len:357 (+) Transcript_53958:55-1125(+)
MRSRLAVGVALAAVALMAVAALGPTYASQSYAAQLRLRMTRAERLQMRQDRKRQKTAAPGMGHDAQHVMAQLKFMVKSKTPKSPLPLLEEYLEIGGRSPTAAYELALKVSAHRPDSKDMMNILQMAVSSGMDKTFLVDALLQELAKVGNQQAAAMVEGMSPRPQLRYHLLHAAIKDKDVSSALEQMQQLRDAGSSIDKKDINGFLWICVRKEGASKAESRFQHILDMGLQPDGTGFGIMLDAFGKKGDVASCQRWFERMEAANFPSEPMHFQQVLKACAKNPPRHAFCAEQLARSMRSRGFSLGPVDLEYLLRAMGPERYKKVCKSLGLCAKLPKAKAIGKHFEAAQKRRATGPGR